MAHTCTSILVHCVFSTKNRRNLISSDMQARLWSYMGGIARENGMKAPAVCGTENHVHALVSIPPTMAVSKALQLVKGGSSKWVHDTYPGQPDFGWQEGYGAFSVGISAVADTIAYINRQLEHHRTTTFEDEYREFLARHGVTPDERYLFG